MTVNAGTSYAGLFGITSGATLQNIGVTDASVTGANYVGLLAGQASATTTLRAYSTGEAFVTAANGSGGGLIGYHGGGSSFMDDCYSHASVTGNNNYVYLGGLAGRNFSGTIQTSFSTGEISVIKGKVSSNVGGLVGVNNYRIKDSYWNTETSGKTSAVASTSGTGSSTDAVGLTTDEMLGDNARISMAAFNFEDIWEITDSLPGLTFDVITPSGPGPDEEGSDADKDNAGNTTINGNIEGTVISFTVPTELSFLVNPNAVEGERFVAPEFTVSNDSNSPLTLSVGTFEETTDLFTDVHGDRYQDSEWDKLGVKDSKQFALALNLEEGENWLVQTQLESLYAKSVQDVESDVELGTIRPNSDVAFNFSAKHGLAFKEALNPEYSITFIFDLFNE